MNMLQDHSLLLVLKEGPLLAWPQAEPTQVTKPKKATMPPQQVTKLKEVTSKQLTTKDPQSDKPVQCIKSAGKDFEAADKEKVTILPMAKDPVKEKKVNGRWQRVGTKLAPFDLEIQNAYSKRRATSTASYVKN